MDRTLPPGASWAATHGARLPLPQPGLPAASVPAEPVETVEKRRHAAALIAGQANNRVALAAVSARYHTGRPRCAGLSPGTLASPALREIDDRRHAHKPFSFLPQLTNEVTRGRMAASRTSGSETRLGVWGPWGGVDHGASDIVAKPTDGKKRGVNPRRVTSGEACGLRCGVERSLSMDMFVSAIVLAAGSSVRVGRPKQLLPLAGRPLLQHVLDAALQSCVNEVVLVLGYRAPEVRAALDFPHPERVSVVTNHRHQRGLSSSLRLGLRSTRRCAQGAAILLGDQVGVTPELIDRVAQAFAAADALVARPVFRTPQGARIPGHPVFLARRIWSALENCRGDRGARDVIAAHPEWVLEVPVDGVPPDDIDTWEDYRRVAAAFAS